MATAVLRTELRPGDLGALIRLHGIVYADECGFDATFEAYVAATVAECGGRLEPDRDRIWLAEQDDALVGCIAILAAPYASAQLRWFLVHPDARGQGLGRRLLAEAVAFARDAGYGRIFLRTIAELPAAAHLYRAAGFDRTASAPREIWGQRITDERYELDLALA